MARWGMPEPRDPAPAAAAAASRSGPASSPPAPSKGFGAAFKALVSRKLRELTGRRWEGASERARQAEAARRSAAEMARRIERETGRRPAEATIRRNARQNRTPRGVDQVRTDRQARIDTAGGIAQLARQIGVRPRAVTRWRDFGTPMVPGGVRVSADVQGILWVAGEPYPRILTVSVTFDPPASDEIRAAFAVSDYDTIADLLGPAITVQTEWAGEAERYFEVEAITDVTIT